MFKILTLILAASCLNVARAAQTADDVEGCKKIHAEANLLVARAGARIHQLEDRKIITYDLASKVEYANTRDTIDEFWRIERFSRLGVAGTKASCEIEYKRIELKVNSNMKGLQEAIKQKEAQASGVTGSV